MSASDREEIDVETTDDLGSPQSAASSPRLTTASPDQKETKSKLEQLRSHPLFGDLQVTLALDCLQSNVPFTLLSEVCGAAANRQKPTTDMTAFSTVSEKIIRQHIQLQGTLLTLGSRFPSLLTVYQQITEQVESQRYRALAYNCYSDNCKQLINWFYDSERQLLIERIQESVNMLVLNEQRNSLQLSLKLNGK